MFNCGTTFKTIITALTLSVAFEVPTSFAQYAVPPANKTVSVGNGYTQWLSLSPGQCVSDEEAKVYLDEIVFALEVLQSIQIAEEILQQYADEQRCDKVVGNTLAMFSEHRGVLESSEIVRYEEWLGEEEIKDRNLEEELEEFSDPPTEEIADPNALNPFFCLTTVTQEQTNWRTGSWKDTHKLICTIGAVGVIKTRWKGKKIEQKTTIATIKAYNLQFWAPAGGTITHVKNYNVTLQDAVIPDPNSSEYSIEITIPAGDGTGAKKQKASFSKRPINLKGRAYPRLKSTGRKEVWFPDAPPKMNPRTTRANNFDTLCKNYYATKGWPYPDPQNPGQVAYQNHHVRPVRWAGQNLGKNCYRLSSGAHHWFTMWWEPRGNFKTPVSQ